MRIKWVLSAASVVGDGDSLASPLASYRYRAAIPMATLRARGHTCSWHGVRQGERIGADHPALQDADVAIFGKNHSEPSEIVGLMEHARARGVATVVDMCDDYFEPGHQLEHYYRVLAERADLVTASSRILASAIEDATEVKPHLVRDPYEGPGGAARWTPVGRHVKALWFGTPFNLESLLAEAAELPPKIKDYTLDIQVLTRECAGLVDGLRQLSERSGAKLTLQFQEWSLERNWTALGDCDLTVIPVKQGARFFQAKGPNRLVETLRAGRFAAVHPMLAYDEFKPWCWIGDIAEGVAWSLDHAAEVVQRIVTAQAYIEDNYSPAAVAAEWEIALAEAARRGARPVH